MVGTTASVGSDSLSSLGGLVANDLTLVGSYSLPFLGTVVANGLASVILPGHLSHAMEPMHL